MSRGKNKFVPGLTYGPQRFRSKRGMRNYIRNIMRIRFGRTWGSHLRSGK